MDATYWICIIIPIKRHPNIYSASYNPDFAGGFLINFPTKSGFNERANNAHCAILNIQKLNFHFFPAPFFKQI